MSVHPHASAELNTRGQHQQTGEVTINHGQFDYARMIDRFSQGCVIGAKLHSCGRHFDVVRGRADLHLKVDSGLLLQFHGDARLGLGLKAFTLRGHCVVADIDEGKRVISVGVGHGLPLFTCSDSGERNSRGGNDCAGTIGYCPKYFSGSSLSYYIS